MHRARGRIPMETIMQEAFTQPISWDANLLVEGYYILSFFVAVSVDWHQTQVVRRRRQIQNQPRRHQNKNVSPISSHVLVVGAKD